MLRINAFLILASLLCGCAGQAELSAPDTGQAAAQALSDADKCRIALAAEPTAASFRFATTGMQLLNWNTQKNVAGDMRADLERFGANADLILLQEAVRDSHAFDAIEPAYHLSFAKGYQRNQSTTGVLTASRISPLAQCSLTHVEPWLRSAKATSITEFALQGTDETLLVINVHLINFTIGVQAMREQLLAALSFVETHTGPVIVSGDFNTWRKGRSKVVADALQNLGLEAVSYETDHRKRFMGNALDHTYVRNVTISRGTSYQVGSSDHNPTAITLEF